MRSCDGVSNIRGRAQQDPAYMLSGCANIHQNHPMLGKFYAPFCRTVCMWVHFLSIECGRGLIFGHCGKNKQMSSLYTIIRNLEAHGWSSRQFVVQHGVLLVRSVAGRWDTRILRPVLMWLGCRHLDEGWVPKELTGAGWGCLGG